MTAIREPRQGIPVDAPLQSRPGARGATELRKVAEQFDVLTNPRYHPPGDGRTWCNIFAGDVTRAMGCEVPHWVRADGTPALPGAPGAHELNANAVCDWLRSPVAVAPAGHGWSLVGAGDANAAAARGECVVVSWQNPVASRPGHVAILLPPVDGQQRIAQAGASNYFDVPLARGFGSLPVKFYRHP